MKCRWCGGGGGECGCGTGKCEHCDGTGELTNPPYGAVIRNVLPKADMQALASEWCARARPECDMAAFVQDVAQRAAKRALPDSVAQAFAEYWEDGARDENLGEFIQRVAQYAADLPPHAGPAERRAAGPACRVDSTRTRRENALRA
jgi:hypothetical protein